MKTSLLDPVDVEELISRGFVRVTVDQSAAAVLDRVLQAASAFFSLPSERKHRASSPDPNFGFRPTGLEYSQTPLRPDLIESYSIWGTSNSARTDDEVVGALVRALHSWREVLEPAVGQLLLAMASCFDAEAPLFADASSAQVNECVGGHPDREFIQELHEDGHLVTVLHSNAPGLEVQHGAAFDSVELRPDELILLTGSALGMLTDGRIAPAFHQVRNLGHTGRKALMYFVNPTMDAPLRPWVSSGVTGGVDLRDAIRQRPGAFGLPPLPRT